ncbi:MAG: hypothetical protein LBR15_02135 [Methanobrevibacter sp.]|jgi:hypothetical protein|nr:hypothetical protein [Candidatus Methanovirga australis]
MNPIIIAILYGLSGFLMKLSDDEYDENNDKIISSLLGIFAGLICGFLASHDTNATYIFLGILIAALLSLKIDGIHHVVTLITFTTTYLFFGLINLNIFILAICVVSAFIDEIGNDKEYIYKRSRFFKVFFDYRFTMKIAIFSLSVLGLVNILYGFEISFIGFLAPETIVYFLLFELSYETARKISKI